MGKKLIALKNGLSITISYKFGINQCVKIGCIKSGWKGMLKNVDKESKQSTLIKTLKTTQNPQKKSLPSNKLDADSKMESNGIKIFSTYLYCILNQARRCTHPVWWWMRILLLTSKRVVGKCVIKVAFSVAHRDNLYLKRKQARSFLKPSV